MRGLTGVLAGVVAMGWVIAAIAPRPPAPKASVSVDVTPRLAPRIPALVWLTVRLNDPLQEFVCPEFRIHWGDGTKASESPRCEPYVLNELQPTSYTHRVKHPYYWAGTFRVDVEAQGWGLQKIARGSRDVIVLSPEGEP